MTPPNPTKPNGGREFWLEPLGGRDACIYFNEKDCVYKAPEQIVHVIEHSAYEALQARFDEALAELKLYKRLAENRDKLLVCYRTGKSPSMKLLDQLTADREKVKAGL